MSMLRWALWNTAMGSSSDPLLSILIPVSSRTDLLAGCLAAIGRHVPGNLSHETIVVLNAIDASVARELESRHPEVRFLRSPVNLGMAGSVNRSRRVASGRFLVTLHDDATIEPGWAEALLEAAHRHPRAGAIGSKVLFPDGRLQSAGAIVWQSGATTPPWSGPAPSASDVMPARAVDYCGTCSLLIRAEAFDASGGFDEVIYPGYFVDVDFGLALRAQGYYVLCAPRSVVHHHRHASSSRTLRTVAIARNRAYVLRKWAAALAGHEPQPQPINEQAVTMALLRAARFAEACEAGLSIPTAPASDCTLDKRMPADDEIERHYLLSRELLEAIIAHLETALAARDASLARCHRTRADRVQAALVTVRRSLSTSISRVFGRGR